MRKLYGDLRRMCRKIRIIPKTQHLDYRQSYCSVACNGRHNKCAYTWRKLSIIARLSIFAHGKVISGLILIHVSTTAAHCDLVFRQTNGCRYWAWKNGETCADKPCSFDQSNAKWSQCRTVLRLILIQGWSMNFGGQTWEKQKSAGLLK